MLSAFPNAIYIASYEDPKQPGGVYRFMEKPIMRWMCDNGVDLNAMCIAHEEGDFSLKEYMQFYMDIGYSLCGFSEIFGGAIDRMNELGITHEQLDEYPTMKRWGMPGKDENV